MGMPKFFAGLALALTLSFAPITQAHAYQHSITILTEDEEHEGPENPEHRHADSDDIQFVILGCCDCFRRCRRNYLSPI